MKNLTNKKTILILILMLSTNLVSFCQNLVSLNLQNTSLKAIIKSIEAQTSYSFIFSNDEVNEQDKLSLKVEDEVIDTTLHLLFKQTSIDYKIKNNHIILSAKKPENNNSIDVKHSISGSIKDVLTGETLIGATITVESKNIGTTTNEYGFFSLTLPQNTYTFNISYIGFETKKIEIDLTKNIKMQIELQPSSNNLNEVSVTSDKGNNSQVKNILSGITSLKSSDIKQLPSLLGEPDVTKVLLTQPGVTTVGEGATGFNVRGGNIDQNLILLDEAPVYNSSHAWGLFSIFNADVIKNLDLYKGGIPARFGGRGSSVLEIRQKEGSNKRFKGEGGIGTLFSRLTLEGPLKKEKLSFLVSGRRSYFDVFFPYLGDEVKNNTLFFYDLSTKLAWNINENNKLFVSGFFGADVMKLKFESGTNANGHKNPDEIIDFRWKNATTTLRWNHLFSSKLFMNTSAIYSRYNYALLSQNDTGGGPVGTSGSFKWSSVVENLIFKPDFTFYINTETTIRFGANGTLYKFSPAKLKSIENGINSLNFNIEYGLELAPYIEFEKNWGLFSVNTGLRYSWFGNFGPYSTALYNPNLPKDPSTKIGTKHYKKGELITNYDGLEPRLSLKYDVNENGAVKLGYNRIFQYIHLISNTDAALPFDIWKISGIHIKPLEVNQFSTGYAFDTPNEKYNFSLDVYYKSFKNIVEYINGADLFLNNSLETQLLPAVGFSYGAEVAAYKNTGLLTGNINYTYSVTRRKTISPFKSSNINNGEYFPSNYDKPHHFNITVNYKLHERWSFIMFFTYQTGRPTTIPTGKFIYGGSTRLTYSDRNVYRIPNTHRLDISFTYKSTRPNKKWDDSWVFGAYNVYGHKNAFSIFYIFNNNEVKTYQYSLVGVPIPFLTYNFKF